MGFFSRLNKKPASTIGSPKSTTSTILATPASPAPTFSARSIRGPPLPNVASSSSAPSSPSIRLRVAVDGADARDLFYINVSPDDGPGAVRREVAQIVGHSCMTLFKVSIPWQAHSQARAYTERYGKQVDLLAAFAAFNLDDPAQLQTSLPPAYREMAEVAVESGSVTMKDWFPTQNSSDSEIISILARPAPDACLLNSVPLTLRAYIATPTQANQSTHSRAASSGSRPRPPPIVIDITPYITVDELKMELLRATGRNDSDWRHVTLWQIAMTDNEMNVIDELGRLKGGKMPWPYPPGAMEPIAMSDGNLPVCLFFPKSAPFGDMLDISVWIDAAAGQGIRPTASLGTASDIPPFRYPMPLLSPPKRPASISEASQISALQLPVLPPSVPGTPTLEVPAPSFKKGSRLRSRPSTAPAAVSDAATPVPKAPAFGSRSAHPLRSVQTNMAPPPLPLAASQSANAFGLGIVTGPAKVERTSFASSIACSEDEGSLPSLNFSQVSFERVDSAPPLRTPDVERVAYFTTAVSAKEGSLGADELGVKKSSSLHLKHGSLSARIRRARAGI